MQSRDPHSQRVLDPPRSSSAPLTSTLRRYALPCTRDLLAEGFNVTLGAGLSIGSVAPHPDHNCVRDVVVRNVTLLAPFKVVYVKSNTGDDPEGDALIENVRFEDIYAERSLLWPVRMQICIIIT